METATISEFKKEIKHMPPELLQETLIRLAKFKKENKELLHYIIFESSDEQVFIQKAKEEVDEQFKNLNRNSFYLAKKTLRKVLRTIQKYIRFSGNKETEVELLIYFCTKMKESKLNYRHNRVVFNMFMNQIKRIKKVLSALHDDIQYDYRESVQSLLL
jgi:hypothetical protein